MSGSTTTVLPWILSRSHQPQSSETPVLVLDFRILSVSAASPAPSSVVWVFAGGKRAPLTYSFSYLELGCCSMSSSNYCLLTCIQVSQEGGQVVWYSHLFQNFPLFIVIHTVKGFGIINKAEIDVFLELSCFFHDPADVGNLISGSSAFFKTSLHIREFMVHVLLKSSLNQKNLSLLAN